MKKELELHLVLDKENMDSLYVIMSFYKMANSMLSISDSESKYEKFASEIVTVIEVIKKNNGKEF